MVSYGVRIVHIVFARFERFLRGFNALQLDIYYCIATYNTIWHGVEFGCE